MGLIRCVLFPNDPPPLLFFVSLLLRVEQGFKRISATSFHVIPSKVTDKKGLFFAYEWPQLSPPPAAISNITLMNHFLIISSFSSTLTRFINTVPTDFQ